MAHTQADYEAALAQAQAQATCPLCGARRGEPCTYALAVRDEDERFSHWQFVQRRAHQARVAAATNYEWYGYALREMERYCVCGPDMLAAGIHPKASCRYHTPARAT